MPGTRQNKQYSIALETVENELKNFEAAERRRLGLEQPRHWHDPNPRRFTAEERGRTTLLFGGLTILHDQLIQAALKSLGYNALALDCPDNAALQVGKEFGNRGQCNPTYFTVGNLVKYLVDLRDRQGLSTQEIVDNYLFITAGACGPCRFGMYTTEYRKALRDAGFEGFRVVVFSQVASATETLEQAGLEIGFKFYYTLYKCIIAGDVLNAMGYRIRPYEVEAGSTDAALARCRELVAGALAAGQSVRKALRRCRRLLEAVQVDRSVPKPKVAVIGEFWAMTTEGDGNYHLKRFLEQEGAEVDHQMIINWGLYTLWEVEYDTRERMRLHRLDPYEQQRIDRSPRRTILLTRLAVFFIKRFFYSYARAVGLKNYHLPDMNEIARISHKHYYNELRGGEGHMEIGKVIQTFANRKAHLVISVKPFGCMPSSGVSDGVQSIISSQYPDINFLAIETSGDGAVNVYSRVQMALFKARQKAKEELQEAMRNRRLTEESLQQKLAAARYATGIYYPRHRVAGTAANAVYDLA